MNRPLTLTFFALAGMILATSAGSAQERLTSAGTTSPNLRYYYPLPKAEKPQRVEADICVYGGTSGGIAAAIQARRMGKTVALVEFGKYLGGLTTGGLGATDIGNKGAIGGISREFYRRIGQHYGQEEGWTFEPSAATKVYNAMLAEARVPVYREQRLASVKKNGNRIEEIRMENGNVFRAKVFIDSTYEGDLLAKAGVSYHVGREANAKYHETLNGVQYGHPHHNFKVPVDPFVVEGDPKSGLLPGISSEPPGEHGQGDHRVQAYNFRMCLTRAEDRLPFPRPKGYDPQRYTLLARYIQAGVWDALRLTKMMPNGKTDTNNFGGFSTDNIGMNYGWPDGDYQTREKIFQEHVTYQQGLMWFLCNDERVPQKIRDEVRAWGLPRDEFTETGGWPHQLYVREARRMISDYVMTEHHCRGKEVAPDAVGLAAYTMDSHNCQRIARIENGRWTARNEGDVEIGGFPPYPISYQSIVPKEKECANLLVPVCLSSSHIAYGSIRMEPVFMVLGQSAATAASMAIDGKTAVQDVHLSRLQGRLIQDGQILVWPPPATR